jgi:hypothetical protein
MVRETKTVFRDQSGAALAITLIMIIVLTLICLAASFTSIFEIRLSGNKRGSTDAFFAADTGVQVVMASADNFSLPGQYDAAGTYHYSQNHSMPNPTNADIIIYHNSMQSGAPKGLGFSATGNFEFMHYLIESTGKDQIESNPLKSTSVVQEKVVRLVPTLQGGN